MMNDEIEEKPKRKKTPTPLSAGTQTSPQMQETHLGGEKAQVYFTREMWKGVKEVFKCARCGAFRDTRDEMIEHVLLHFPKSEQESILEKLLKE